MNQPVQLLAVQPHAQTSWTPLQKEVRRGRRPEPGFSGPGKFQASRFSFSFARGTTAPGTDPHESDLDRSLRRLGFGSIKPSAKDKIQLTGIQPDSPATGAIINLNGLILKR
jgi:hypothetical protein